MSINLGEIVDISDKVELRRVPKGTKIVKDGKTWDGGREYSLSSLCPMYYNKWKGGENLSMEMNAPCHFSYKEYYKDSDTCYNILRTNRHVYSYSAYKKLLFEDSFLSEFCTLIYTKVSTKVDGEYALLETAKVKKPDDDVLPHSSFWTSVNALFRQEWEFRPWVLDNTKELLGDGCPPDLALFLTFLKNGSSFDRFHSAHAAIYSHYIDTRVVGGILTGGRKCIPVELLGTENMCNAFGMARSEYNLSYLLSDDLYSFAKKKSRAINYTRVYLPYKYPTEEYVTTEPIFGGHKLCVDYQAIADHCINDYNKYINSNKKEEAA